MAPADWARIAELVAKYRNLALGSVDASVVAAEDRPGIHEIGTLDLRHFVVVQGRDGHFTVLP